MADVPISIGVRALTYTRYAPKIAFGYVVKQPGVRALTTSTFGLTVSAPMVRAIAVGALSFAGTKLQQTFDVDPDLIQVDDTIDSFFLVQVFDITEDGIEVDDTAVDVHVGFLVIDALAVSDSCDGLMTSTIDLDPDKLVLRDPMYLIADDLKTYVVNLATGAPSRYGWAEFTSFASSPDRQFATTPYGLYELTGNNDAGANISAYITTGQSILQSHQQKRVSASYLGVKANGAMRFKVYADTQEWSYDIEIMDAYADANVAETARAVLGRGLKATVWHFEVQNDLGSKFELSHLNLLVIPLSRRR